MSDSSEYLRRRANVNTQPVEVQPEVIDPNAPAEPIAKNTFETNPSRMQAWIDYQKTLGDEVEVERVQKLLDAYNAGQR